MLGRSHGRAPRVGLNLLPTVVSLLLGAPTLAAGQDSVVTGTVVAARSLVPIQGAELHVVGTDLRTRTDAAGRFALQRAAGTALTLQLRALGYRAQTRTVAPGENALRITLTEVAVELDALVVTGTAGATEVRAVGNAVEQLAAEKVLQDAPVADVQQLLGSRVPGVSIMPYRG